MSKKCYVFRKLFIIVWIVCEMVLWEKVGMGGFGEEEVCDKIKLIIDICNWNRIGC